MTHVDLEAATEHGVLVVNTPARNATAVAELTVGLMLALVRNIPAAHQMVSSGGWVDPTICYSSFRGTELSRKTIGIVGFGAIGQQVARMLSAFETALVVYDPYVCTRYVYCLHPSLVCICQLLTVALSSQGSWHEAAPKPALI